MKKVHWLILIIFMALFINIYRQNLSFKKEIEVNKILNEVESTMYLYDFSETIDKTQMKEAKEINLSDRKLMKSDAIYKMHYFLFDKNSLNKSGKSDNDKLRIQDTIAFEYDIDDDGVEEIIGSNLAEPFFKDGYGEFYVLKKRDEDYTLLASFPINLSTQKIYILETKTDVLRDIGIVDSDNGSKVNLYQAKFKENNKYFDEDNIFEVSERKYNKIYAYEYVYDKNELKKLKNSAYFAEYKFFDFSKSSLKLEKDFLNFISKDYVEMDEYEKLKNSGRNWAIGFDLNSDGLDEIIGINDSQFMCGILMNCFSILQQDEIFNYKNIEQILFNREFYKFRVLKNKTNGFYDLYLFSTQKNGDRLLRYQKVH